MSMLFGCSACVGRCFCVGRCSWRGGSWRYIVESAAIESSVDYRELVSRGEVLSFSD